MKSVIPRFKFVLIIMLVTVTMLSFCIYIKNPKGGTDMLIHVKDFGAIGDGVKDDGPAINAAFAAARTANGAKTVVFEKKTYKIGDNPDAWHYFQMQGYSDLTIDGNGATLSFDNKNLGFLFNRGENIVIRNLTFDMYELGFTQGKVIGKSGTGSFDVEIHPGYPAPDIQTGQSGYSGGGRHMIVFDQNTKKRNVRMTNDHLDIDRVVKVLENIYRFFPTEESASNLGAVAEGNLVTYGFNRANISTEVTAKKSLSAQDGGQISVMRVKNIVIDNVKVYGSKNMGIRLFDMPGDVTLRAVQIIPYPSTRTSKVNEEVVTMQAPLISVPSDGIHIKNVKGILKLESCTIAATGDDNLAIGTYLEKIEAVNTVSGTMDLTLIDTSIFYSYEIEKGDQLDVYDISAKKVYKATVTQAPVSNSKETPKITTRNITIDKVIPELSNETKANFKVLNLNRSTNKTIITDCTFEPVLRNAMLVRAQNMTILRNLIDCSRGGANAIRLGFDPGFGAGCSLKNLMIEDNRIYNPTSYGIVNRMDFMDEDNKNVVKVIKILNNEFKITGTARDVYIEGADSITSTGNTFMKNGVIMTEPSTVVRFVNVDNLIQ